MSYLILLAALALAAPAHAQQDATTIGTKLIAEPSIKAALDAIKASEQQTLDDQVPYS